MDRQTIILIVVLLVLGGGGYLWYQSRQTVSSEISEIDTAIVKLEARMAEIRQLKTITLDTSVLSDPFFTSLRDITGATTSVAEPGRNNPFAPF